MGSADLAAPFVWRQSRPDGMALKGYQRKERQTRSPPPPPPFFFYKIFFFFFFPPFCFCFPLFPPPTDPGPFRFPNQSRKRK